MAKMPRLVICMWVAPTAGALSRWVIWAMHALTWKVSSLGFELKGTLRDTSLSSYSGVLVLAKRFAVLQEEQISVHTVYRR
jgi:hypothetical protein